MGDLPRAIEKRGRAAARSLFQREGIEARWISETSADIAIRPRTDPEHGTPPEDRHLCAQLKYSESRFGNWVRYLKSSINKERHKCHDMIVLAMSAERKGFGCTIQVHQARPVQSSELGPDNWKPLKEVAQDLRDAYSEGQGHASSQLEYSTIASSTRLVEHVMRKQFLKKLEPVEGLTPHTDGEHAEYGAVDYFLKLKGKKRATRVQEKVLKVRKKDGKGLGLRADLVRYGYLFPMF
eukprot:g2693.t1